MSNQLHAVASDAPGRDTASLHTGGIGALRGGRPTMKDVASRAGVALKTVSRVVNGEPGVTPETARRVLGAIEDLGFRRNESARLLRTGRTATLGFIADTWTDPDLTGVYRGLEEVVRQHGYLLYSGSTDSDAEREERLALAMCARRVDGLIIAPTPGSHDYLVAEIEAGVAAVFVLRPPELVRSDAVLPDERAGGRAAVAHLVAQGHRRIGLVGGPPADSPVGPSRFRGLLAGYTEAMASAGITAAPGWTALSAADLPGAPVTAVVCAHPAQTRAALRALARAGLTGSGRAGPGSGRMAVIGFGDFEAADLITPPVTVVGYDPVLIGHTAGEVLIRRMAGEQGPPRRVEVPVRLIARGSAEFPPER
jgi:LacI family transcriptional regulator